MKFQHIFSSYKTSLVFIIIIILAYQLAITFFIPLNSQPKGDEKHFIEAINHFKIINLDTIKDYKEVTPPLVFVIYSLWGKLTGYEISHLRILSLFISFLVFVSIFTLSYQVSTKKHFAFLITILFMLNPYVIGFNIYIFTDMLTLFWICLFCIGFFKKCKTILFFSSMFMLLSRQYSIFLPIAAILYFVFIFYSKRNYKILTDAFIILLSFVPLLLLFLLWKGFAPPSGIRYWLYDEGIRFNFYYLVTYITFIPLYTLPILVLRLKHINKNYKSSIIWSVIGLSYFLFPIEASKVTIEQTNLSTVGLLHKLIKQFFSSPFWENIFFYFFFVFGLLFLQTCVRALFKLVREKNFNFVSLLDISIICFLLIMPFSYQVWEKYLLAIIPIVFIRLLNLGRDENGLHQ